jgi:hypothetical protein
MNIRLLRPAPVAGPLRHGLQMEGLYTIDSSRGTVTFRYRELVSADAAAPVVPSTEVLETTVPLSSTDLANITGIVLAAAAATGQASDPMAPDFGPGGPQPVPPPVTVAIEPVGPLAPGATAQLSATVRGSDNQAVQWSVLDGGTITAGGLYTAPAAPTRARVVAVADANTAVCAVLEVTVA